MAMPEHLKLWNFKVEASSWYWTVTGPDGDVLESTRFSSLRECIENAVQHGFVDPRHSLGLRGS